MTKEDIKKLEPYFVCYKEEEYHDPMGWCNGELCKKMFHKEQSNFHIVLFTATDVVYQLNTDHEIFGVELETYDELVTRFKSFTREDIDNISEKTKEAWDDADKRFGLENLTIKDDDDDYEEEKHYIDE